MRLQGEGGRQADQRTYDAAGRTTEKYGWMDPGRGWKLGEAKKQTNPVERSKRSKSTLERAKEVKEGGESEKVWESALRV